MRNQREIARDREYNFLGIEIDVECISCGLPLIRADLMAIYHINFCDIDLSWYRPCELPPPTKQEVVSFIHTQGYKLEKLIRIYKLQNNTPKEVENEI